MMKRILDLSPLHGSLGFHAQLSDYNNCIDISSEALHVDEDGFNIVRHFLVRIDRRDLPELIGALRKLHDNEGDRDLPELIGTLRKLHDNDGNSEDNEVI